MKLEVLKGQMQRLDSGSWEQRHSPDPLSPPRVRAWLEQFEAAHEARCLL